MRIAVVDDDYRVIAQVTNYLDKYFNDTSYTQDDYTDGIEFINSLSESKYNIVFMDLEMEHINGTDAIKKLREIDENENTYVIFISSHDDNLIPLFSLHPFGFIQKPFSYDDIFQYLSRIVNHIQENNRLLPLTINRKNILLPVADILYVHSERHKLIIHLKDSSIYETYEKLNSFEAKLTEISSDFLRIHTSFLVNKKYVTLYKRESLFIGTTELQISRKYLDQVINNLHKDF